MKKPQVVFVCIAFLATFQTSVAFAQHYDHLGPQTENPYAPEFALGVGYSNISLGSNSSINGEGAIHFEPNLSFSPFQKLPQLRLGAGLGSSLVLDNSSRTVIINNGQLTFTGSSTIPFWTLEPELRLSWRQSFGSSQSFFIEPGVAAGGMFGSLDLKSENTDVTYNASDSTGYGKVFLRAGIPVYNGSFGLEATWLDGGNMNFGGNMNGHVSEFYIGIFGALRF